MTSRIILLALISIFLISNVKSETCSCPTSTTLPKAIVEDTSFTLEKEVINEIDYGTPLIISEKLLVLNYKVTVPKSLDSMNNVCPSGYVLLDKSDLELIAATQSNYDVIVSFGIKEAEYLFSSTKTTTCTNGSDAECWKFAAITLGDSTTKSMNISGINTYFANNKNGYVICKASVSIDFPTGDFDFKVNQYYKLAVTNNNIKGALWKIGSKYFNGKSIEIVVNSSGCEIIQAWAKNVVDEVGYNCKVKYIITPLGSDGVVSGIKKADIELKSYPDFTVSTVSDIFFKRLNTAIAPKEDGNLYLLFADSDFNTKVLEIKHTDNSIINTFSIKSNSLPMDICETPFGFVVYLKQADNDDYSYIVGYNKDGSQKFKRTIMNNGDNPTSSTDQISFHDSDGKVAFGLDAIFNAHNGKLAYGRGRIALIFAHYNFFGYKNGKRDDHTGDTLFTFDENGQNEDCAWSWKTSHSLYQTMLYDGQYFVTASLGDAYPESIQVCFVEPNSYKTQIDKVRNKAVYLNYNCNSDLISGGIPGNGSGDSCGRMGGLHKINEYYILVYSRKNCSYGASDGKYGFVRFKYEDNEYTEISNHSIGDASNIIGIRSAKYGDKILIILSTTISPASGNSANSKSYSSSESTEILLVTVDGNITTSKFDYDTEFIVPISEDIKSLKDGTVAWGIAKRDTKELNLVKTPTPSYVDPYKYSYDDRTYVNKVSDGTGDSASSGDSSVIEISTDNSSSSEILKKISILLVCILIMIFY